MSILTLAFEAIDLVFIAMGLAVVLTVIPVYLWVWWVCHKADLRDYQRELDRDLGPRPVDVKYEWSDETPEWEQYDGGKPLKGFELQ